jgi:hypothetical protein
MKSTEKLFEEFHTEIMVQTARGCPGANFSKANKIYEEFFSAQHSAHWTARLARKINCLASLLLRFTPPTRR